MGKTSRQFAALGIASVALALGAVGSAFAQGLYDPSTSSDVYGSTTNAVASATTNPQMAGAVTAGLGLGGWLAVAAVILLIAGAGWLAWQASQAP